MNKADFFFYCDTLLANERVIVTTKELLVFPYNYIYLANPYHSSLPQIYQQDTARSTEQIKKGDKVDLIRTDEHKRKATENIEERRK